MKVLVATDGSIYSEAALNSVASRPWSEDSEFLILHVVHAIAPSYMGFNNGYTAAIGVLDDMQNQMAKRIVNESVSLLEEKLPGKSIAGKIAHGHVVEQIVSTAQEFNADLIVMASHGRTGFTRFILGSVAEAVLNRTPCSVEIVRVDFEKEAEEREKTKCH